MDYANTTTVEFKVDSKVLFHGWLIYSYLLLWQHYDIIILLAEMIQHVPTEKLWTCPFKFVVGSIPCSACFAYGTNVRCGCATSKSLFIHLFLLILFYSLILFIILLNFLRDYLRGEQPYTSTLIVIADFQVCGRNLKYIASNTWTSLRTTVFWSVLPVRICRVKREQRLWSKLSCLS